MDNPEI